MSFPTVTVEVAWTTDPLDASPSYTDISTYALSFTSARGRSDNLADISAQKATVKLDDRDLRFDPLNTGGAYYPNVKPRRKVRISAVYNAVTYYPWTGFLERMPPDWRRPGYTEVEAEAQDGFSILSLADLPAGSYPAELTSDRIARVLDAVGWPSGATHRNLDTGKSTVVAVTIADGETKALAHLQDVAKSELGLVFIDGQGRFTFHNRQHRFDTASDYTSVATFGDGGGTELDWDDVGPDWDLDRVINQWSITPYGGAVIVRSDATSKAAYGPRGQSRELLISDVNEATDQADWLLARTKDVAYRFDRLILRPSAIAAGSLQDSLFAQALGREIGDRITVKVRPPGGGYTISQECWIEGVQHKVSDQSWETVFMLDTVDPTLQTGAGYWILDDTTYSVLDTSTRLAV